MTRGMAAAEQQEWDLAIKYFSEARKAAPTWPSAQFNLALAYDSAGGREVPAVVFFRAYLEVEPKALNADEVKRYILRLEASVEAKVRRLFKQAVASAEALLDGEEKAWGEIIKEMARAGELDWARKVAIQHPSGATGALASAARDKVEEGKRGRLFKAQQIFTLAEEVAEVESERFAREVGYISPIACAYNPNESNIACYEGIRESKRQWKRDWKERVDFYLGYNLECLGAHIHRAGFRRWGWSTYRRGVKIRVRAVEDNEKYTNKLWRFARARKPSCYSFVIMEMPDGDVLMDSKGGISWDPSRAPPIVNPTPEPPSISWVNIARGDVGEPTVPFNLGDDALLDLPFAVQAIKGEATNEIPGRLAQLARKFALALQFLQKNHPSVPK